VSDPWESVSKPVQTLQLLGSNAVDVGSSFSFQNHDSSSLHSYYRVSQSYTWHAFFSIYVQLFFCFKEKVFGVAAAAAASAPSSLPQFHFPTTTTKNFYNYRMWIVKPGDKHLKHAYTQTRQKKKPQILPKSRIISNEML
jgi:hypothetical protein